jgi:hypothetical protein
VGLILAFQGLLDDVVCGVMISLCKMVEDREWKVDAREDPDVANARDELANSFLLC